MTVTKSIKKISEPNHIKRLCQSNKTYGSPSGKIDSPAEVKSDTVSKSAFIGEYNESGFGEIFASPSRDIYYRNIAKSKAAKENLFIESDSKFGKYLLRLLNDDYIKMTAEYFGRLDAEEFYKKFFDENAFITISELAGTHFDKGEILEKYLYGLSEACKNLLKSE